MMRRSGRIGILRFTPWGGSRTGRGNTTSRCSWGGSTTGRVSSMAFNLREIQQEGPRKWTSILGRLAKKAEIEALGIHEVERNLLDLIGKMARAGDIRTKKMAEKIKELAKNAVPYKTGALFETIK